MQEKSYFGMGELRKMGKGIQFFFGLEVLGRIFMFVGLINFYLKYMYQELVYVRCYYKYFKYISFFDLCNFCILGYGRQLNLDDLLLVYLYLYLNYVYSFFKNIF